MCTHKLMMHALCVQSCTHRHCKCTRLGLQRSFNLKILARARVCCGTRTYMVRAYVCTYTRACTLLPCVAYRSVRAVLCRPGSDDRKLRPFHGLRASAEARGAQLWRRALWHGGAGRQRHECACIGRGGGQRSYTAHALVSALTATSGLYVPPYLLERGCSQKKGSCFSIDTLFFY